VKTEKAPASQAVRAFLAGGENNDNSTRPD
jgi:hypothetical protein